MLAPPGEFAPPPRGNPGSATGYEIFVIKLVQVRNFKLGLLFLIQKFVKISLSEN